MNSKNKLHFEVVFKIFCISGAIATTVWCCYEFSKNEDICEVYYKAFLEDNQSIYPDLTLMIPYQLNETAFRNSGVAMNTSTFKKILRGDYWDDEILDVSLEDTSLKLDNYMISSCILASQHEPCTPIEAITNTMFVGGIRSHAFHLPRDKPTTLAVFQFRKSIFSNGFGPEEWHDLMIVFQYPNRILRSYGSLFSIQWPLDTDQKYPNHLIDIKLRDMEVIQRREKRGSECLDVEDYDAKKKEDIMLEVGCRPYFWSHSKVDRICKNQEEISHIMTRTMEIFLRLKHAEHEIPPCTDIKKLQIDHNVKTATKTVREEFNVKGDKYTGNDTWFEIRLEIQIDSFKEIRQKRAYTPQNLIGNLGGYLGLFIGFTLLDLIKCMKLFSSGVRKYIPPSFNEKKNIASVKEV